MPAQTRRRSQGASAVAQVAPAQPSPVVPPPPMPAPAPVADELPSLPTEDLSLREVPKDELSRKVCLLLLEQDADDDAYGEALDLLDQRHTLATRLTALNARILHLAADAKAREWELEELKIAQHLDSIDTLPDLDEEERLRESMEHVESFVEIRDALKASVLLLAQLETSRASLAQEYAPLIVRLQSILPEGIDSPLEAEVADLMAADLQAFTELNNHATSEGEWTGDANATLADLDEFLAELEEDEESGALVKHEGDSLFQID